MGDEPGLAVPYTRGMDEHHGFHAEGPRRAHTLAAGSPLDVASSTVGDLHRLAQALAVGKLLRPQTRARLFAGHAEMPGETRYGYGFIVRGEGASRSVRHGGGAPGISTSFELYPESGWTVVVLTNDDPHSAERVTRPLETWLARAIRPAEPSA